MQEEEEEKEEDVQNVAKKNGHVSYDTRRRFVKTFNSKKRADSALTLAKYSEQCGFKRTTTKRWINLYNRDDVPRFMLRDMPEGVMACTAVDSLSLYVQNKLPWGSNCLVGLDLDMVSTAEDNRRYLAEYHTDPTLSDNIRTQANRLKCIEILEHVRRCLLFFLKKWLHCTQNTSTMAYRSW
jgi:hypothetical protein